MRKFVAAAVMFIAVSEPATARFRWRDLDPMNRNSKVRAGLRRIDPTMAFRRVKENAYNNLASAVAEDADFREEVEAKGWTTDKCKAAGLGIALPLITLKGAGICAAVTVGEPVALTACISAVAAGTAGIVEIACTQLCHDHHLRDCQ